jgi:hypothetical protein
MCEKCGFSGCKHDWKKWNPNEYWKGYNDYIKNPQTEMMDGNSAYNAGIVSARNESVRITYKK